MNEPRDKAPAENANADGELVIVLHGIAANPALMYPLCQRLRAQGFRVDNWGYSSILYSIEKHAASFRERLLNYSAEPRVHLVAHSLGSLVIRAALKLGEVPNLGRIVLLTPPSLGSPVARYVSPVLGPLCRPLVQLSDQDAGIVHNLPGVEPFEVGVLAAKYDLVVPLANTHVAGEREHLVVNATHNSILISKAAADLVGRFLRTGTFAENVPADKPAQVPGSEQSDGPDLNG